MTDLPCPNGAGSINNPANPTNPPVGPYVPPTLCMGEWELTSTSPDECALSEQQVQESYIAETLNISGAPINVYKLLGVHEQGNGSVLSQGNIATSMPFPGYPKTGINNGGAWRSLQTSSAVMNTAYVGVDFGIKLTTQNNVLSEYESHKNKWTDVAAVTITQSNIPGYWAQQVRVDITDGSLQESHVSRVGTGDGTLAINQLGINASQSSITVVALSEDTFDVLQTRMDGSMVSLGRASVGEVFHSTVVKFTITEGVSAFVPGDMFSFTLDYVWKRVALFNLSQSPDPQVLNLKQTFKARAVRVVPTLFTGAENWEVLGLDVSDSAPTDLDNIQDLFFNENRDRDYATVPLELKVQYQPGDPSTDLSKFGLSILDQYVFSVSFADMVQKMGRPIVTGDIIEVIPEMQYDHNLKPVRKFLEVTDTGWSSSGYGPAFKPFVYRFTAQQALPSQETRDIFGTMDTQKYMVPDPILIDGVGEQLNTAALTATEEIMKSALDAVPETGTNDIREVAGVPARVPLPPANAKGQPAAVPAPNPNNGPNLYIEAGLPPNNLPYGEGFKLPDISAASDGEYFRLYYPPETNIPARLYRFSAVSNRWIYLETDRRKEYSSFKPSMQGIMSSNTKKSLDDSI